MQEKRRGNRVRQRILGQFRASSVLAARCAEGETELRNWFGGGRSIPGTEEVAGLGRYGRTLTILSSDIFADDEDDDDDLDERWEPRFKR